MTTDSGYTPTIINLTKSTKSTTSLPDYAYTSGSGSGTRETTTATHTTATTSRALLLNDLATLFPHDFPSRVSTLDPETINILARELHAVRTLRSVEKAKMDRDSKAMQKFQVAQEIARLESVKLRLLKANAKLVSDIRRVRRISDTFKCR